MIPYSPPIPRRGFGFASIAGKTMQATRLASMQQDAPGVRPHKDG
ncbi:hypothetical protein CBM2585_B80026 [Cupriavidus taiwanensis]|nr:hypothetical protein CBM2585_B80026 [Cupriavidus taiwanensis]